MKAAFVFSNDRIAPVFDVAQQVYLVGVSAGKVSSQTRQALTDGSIAQKATQLSKLNVDVLVCGAISRQLCELVSAYGIQVISFVAGKLDEVVDAWVNGKLDVSAYAMPGCCRGRRHAARRQAGCKNRRQNAPGRQSGQAKKITADTVDYCLCLKCGYRQPHQPGLPCNRQQCPECGFSLTRE